MYKECDDNIGIHFYFFCLLSRHFAAAATAATGSHRICLDCILRTNSSLNEQMCNVFFFFFCFYFQCAVCLIPFGCGGAEVFFSFFFVSFSFSLDSFLLISHLVPTHFVALVDTYLCIQASAFSSNAYETSACHRNQTQIQNDATRAAHRQNGNTT